MKLSLILTILICLWISPIVPFRLKLTNLICNMTDLSFGTPKCRIKAESRNVQYVTVFIKLNQLPITNVTARFRFLRKANGYKPFLYDFDAKCGFEKRLNPVASIVWSWFTEKTTLKKLCPITEDFAIERLENTYIAEKLGVLPVPLGDYAFYFYFSVNNIPRFKAEFYGTIF